MGWKNINPLWRVADVLTVEQAAALIAEADPHEVDFRSSDISFAKAENWGDEGIAWVKTAFAAITNAINAGTLRATIRRDARQLAWQEESLPNEGERDLTENERGEVEITAYSSARIAYKQQPNWGRTTVAVSDLVKWLEDRNFRVGFFFPNESENKRVSYLDKGNPRYAPKLAAAVTAWQSVTDDDLRGKSPKGAIEKWLREHAAEFGLSDEEGNPNKSGIDQVSAVANWQTKGGAPVTPE